VMTGVGRKEDRSSNLSGVDVGRRLLWVRDGGPFSFAVSVRMILYTCCGVWHNPAGRVLPDIMGAGMGRWGQVVLLLLRRRRGRVRFRGGRGGGRRVGD